MLTNRKIKMWTLISSLTWALTVPALAGEGSWTIGNGAANKDTRTLAVDSTGIVYAGTSGSGLLKSADGGNNWTAINSGIPSNIQINALVTDSNHNVYAGTFANGVYKSSNGGSSWAASSNGMTSMNSSTPDIVRVDALAVAPDGKLYAGTYAGGVFASSNGGASWTNAALTTSHITALAVDPRGNVYAGTFGQGIFKSSDGGSSWIEVNEGFNPQAVGLPVIAGSGGMAVSALATDRSGNIFAATTIGIFKSSNGGSNWTVVNNGLGDTIVFALTAQANGNLYAGTYSHGAYRSSNAGATWTAIDSSFPPNSPISAIAAAASGSVYAGIRTGVEGYTPTTATTTTTTTTPPATTQPTTTTTTPVSTTPTPFSITGSAAGGNSALQLSAQITVASADKGKTGNLYVVAALPGGSIYSLTGSGWLPFSATIQPYATTTLGSHTINIFNGNIDVSLLRGTVFYVGYGSDLGDLLFQAKYAAIYKVQ